MNWNFVELWIYTARIYFTSMHACVFRITLGTRECARNLVSVDFFQRLNPASVCVVMKYLLILIQLKSPVIVSSTFSSQLRSVTETSSNWWHSKHSLWQCSLYSLPNVCRVSANALLCCVEYTSLPHCLFFKLLLQRSTIRFSWEKHGIFVVSFLR